MDTIPPNEPTQSNGHGPESYTTSKETAIQPVERVDDKTEDYLEGWALCVVMTGLILCLFLPALDQLILTTAIPRIVSQFNALSEISWIPNAYFLPMSSFMIVYGQILSLVPIKYVITVAIFLFELGSLMSGVAFNINFLLFGRGVAGVGAAGLFVCVLSAVAQIAPLEKRAKLIGLIGATFSFSSVIGPLVGGAFTQHVTWRWCFYLNLPIGGLAALVIFFFLPNYPAAPRPKNRQGWRFVLGIDYVGALLSIGMTVSFLYPLVEGGNTHPWKSTVIIALFITSGILLALFIAWCNYRGANAILPVRLFRNRGIIGTCIANFSIWMSLTIGLVYLATWYQAVKGDSPTKSGVELLPFSLVAFGFAPITGVIVGKFGRYWHILLLMPLLGAVGAGLEYTINESTPRAKLIGYQILWGVSIGATMQLPTIAVQAEYRESLSDTRYGTSLATFVGFIGRMVGLGMGSALFTNKLSTNLKIFAPDAPFELVLRSVDAIYQLPLEQRTRVIHAYVLSLRYIFILGVPAAGLTILSAFLIRDIDLNAGKKSEMEAMPSEIS